MRERTRTDGEATCHIALVKKASACAMLSSGVVAASSPISVGGEKERQESMGETRETDREKQDGKSIS